MCQVLLNIYLCAGQSPFFVLHLSFFFRFLCFSYCLVLPSILPDYLMFFSPPLCVSLSLLFLSLIPFSVCFLFSSHEANLVANSHGQSCMKPALKAFPLARVYTSPSPLYL